MKKFLIFVCTITCIFGLTACGNAEEGYTEYEQFKITQAQTSAVSEVIPMIDMFTAGNIYEGELDEYTAEEISYVIAQSFGMEVDGYVLKSAITSFGSAEESIGKIVETGEATARFDDDQIIVNVPVKGEKRDAEAEIIFSNDLFFRLESAALNPAQSFGEMMGRAGLNTLIGMFTVFSVLILISFIISLFKLIPKIQASFAKKEEDTKQGVQNGVNQIAENEAQTQAVEEGDDTELVAVIAAAIASFEGQASTDGFVVRSIRRRAN